MHFRKYFYQPNLAAAIIFLVLFGIAAALHSYQMIRTRTWFMIPFVLGAVCAYCETLRLKIRHA